MRKLPHAPVKTPDPGATFPPAPADDARVRAYRAEVDAAVLARDLPTLGDATRYAALYELAQS